MWASHLKAGGKARGAPAPLPTGLAKEAFQGRILGIDPSLRGTGLAILDFSPPQSGRWLAGETVRPPSGASLPECLGVIARAVERCIGDWSPDVVAIEETIYVQNFRTAQKLGAARGAAIGCAALRGIPVFEYPPLRIKQAVVGYGRASKEQVARQMSVLLGLERQLAFDEADAAATAFCHAMTLGRTGGIIR
jgi:crossover junction endodeoxyribonuclease RuvC